MSEKTNIPEFRVPINLSRRYKIPATDKMVDSVILSVTRGVGMIEGKKWIRLEWGKEGLDPMEAAAFGFDGKNLTSIDGESLNGIAIIDEINEMLNAEPKIVETLTQEINK